MDEIIDRLFVDEDMSEVNQEFGTTNVIDTLIEESQEHPFKDEYIKKLNIAKQLVNFGQVEAGTSNVSKFTPFYTDYINEYDDEFRVKNISITNNGGQYSSSAIKYAIDEDVNTHWETGNPNSDTFKNEVILTLEEAQVVSRLTYKSRTTGKGFAEKFSIYVSPVDSGNNFQKISEGEYTYTTDMIGIQFNPTKAKRIKFVFEKARDNWASISDIRLYKEDEVLDKMKRLFTDGLMDTLSEEFNSLEKLSALEEEVKSHPLYPIYSENIEMAKGILNGTLQNVKSVTAEQYGNRSAHTSKNLKFGFGNNNQPTGIVARPGETIVVYVEAEAGKPLPQLMFSQQEGSFASWGRTVSLHVGKNVITVPATSQSDGWYRYNVTPGGPVYIINPYTEEEQGKAPVIRFATGCEQFPMFDKDTDEEEFLAFLKEYKKRVDEDVKANPNVMDRKVIDTFELVSDHIVFTGTASGAYEAYFNKGGKPTESLSKFNECANDMFNYLGIDGSDEKNDIKYTRENIRLAQPFGYMYAAGSHIGVQRDVMSSVLLGNNIAGWGITHEIGHRTDIGVRTIGEVTNNMLAQYMSFKYNINNKRIPFESHTYKNVISTNSNAYYEGGYFEQLAVFWQLEMIYPGYWAKLNRLYRENNVVLDSENTSNDKLNQLAKYSSIALSLDLTEHFERHGFWVSDETKEFVSQYPKPKVKTWYSNYNYMNYEGEGFSDNVGLTLQISKNGEDRKLTFNVSNEFKDDVMGYEILKDGEVIGFTSTNSFTDSNILEDESVEYTIIAYDKKLNTSEAVSMNSLTPSLSVQQDSIIIKLREDFEPLSLVKAFTYNGEDISSNIVVNGTVNVNEKGIYPIEYVIEDRGVITKKTINVEVVSDYDYLSDTSWVSATAQWGTPRRNTNIKGRINGEITTFEKGFGIHANGKITYDLSNLDYDNFEALLGVDMGIESQTNSSIVFKVIGDGQTLATTNVLRHSDNMVAINVPVKGVKELVIEINDNGNGNTLDHGVIANPKLTTNNAKPSLTVTNKTYKLNESVDFNEGVSAVDAEDGDLSSKVTIISNNFEEGKAGRFEVVYSVTDSDNNTVEKKVYITVYETFVVNKSKYGEFNNLDAYNEEFNIPVASVSNNGGNYGSSVIENAITSDLNAHWETGRANSSSFKNEVIFDLGENTDIGRMTYAARRGGKGFAKKFEIYISSEAEGNDFIFAGEGSYDGGLNDVIEFKLERSNIRRVKFKFINAYQDWASIGNVSFYKVDVLADKISNDLFKDKTKTDITESYNTLEKVDALRQEVKNHPAYELFEVELSRAEDIIKAKIPVLNFEDITYVELNSEFDLMTGVTANDQEDGDITNNVVVNSNEFNINKTGKYTITYKVEDSDNNIVTKTRNILVYSKCDYISDLSWESAVSGWKSVNKDCAVNTSNKIKLNVNGEVKEFNKGIGAATDAEIVYKLDGNYSNFSTYLGTDKNYSHNSTSIIFKIFADGEEVYTSDVIRKDSVAQLVNLDVTGVKELKLVADDGGLGDFASWGDAKLYATNCKPELTIEKDLAVKLGETLEDIVGGYSAIDAEDGDITNKVQVTGQYNVDFNKPGKYEITYTITDLDGNKIEKTRTISVVNMDDFNYLTDYDWKSASQSYSSTKKDVSASDNTLRLTKEDGSIATYERGIGAHANATIIYDLTDKDYEFFTSYVGVDRQMYGTVGSVIFEVYVDGEKVFSSGLMNSRDVQKYIEVNIAGASELKLVVKDGGNGIGSDHATWGDAKLHYAREVEEDEDLSEIIIIKDKYLEKAIKDTLGLNSDDITVGDMLKLTNLSDCYGVESLEGLQYAKNLETLDLEYNEVSDLSPLKSLKKLKNINITNQFIAAGELYIENGKVNVPQNILDIDKNKINPYEVSIGWKSGLTPIDIVLEDGKIVVDESNLPDKYNSIVLKYKSLDGKYECQAIYIVIK